MSVATHIVYLALVFTEIYHLCHILLAVLIESWHLFARKVVNELFRPLKNLKQNQTKQMYKQHKTNNNNNNKNPTK